MDPRMIPKGGSDQEYTDIEQMRNPNDAGVYYHPGAGKFAETGGITLPDGSTSYDQQAGSIQGDAFVQLGYRKANKEELAEFQSRKEERAKAARIEASRKTTTL